MLENKKINENKGITLIALAITIIVLIILAGISITTLTGEKGLINQARNNSEEAQRESIIEKIEADLLKEKTKTGDIPSKEKLKEIIEQNEYNKGALGEDSFVTKDEEYTINYNEIIGWEEKVELKAGDKVYYDTKNTTVGNNGIIECTVLYDKAYNEENGTNYGIQIISSDIVDTIELGNGTGDTQITNNEEYYSIAKNSYNNALKILYNKAQEYANNIYVKNARCVGSKPNDPDWDTEEKYVADDTYTYMKKYNGIFKVEDINYESDYNQLKELNINQINKSYWLATRDIDYSPYDITVYTGLGIRYILDTGSLYGTYLCDMDSYGSASSFSYTGGFRPVFTLKSGVKIIGGNGTEENPYTLGI